MRATFRVEILGNSMFGATDPAEDGIFVEFFFFPNDNLMFLTCVMTFVAWIEFVAAFEPNRYDIFFCRVMHAPRLIVDS